LSASRRTRPSRSATARTARSTRSAARSRAAASRRWTKACVLLAQIGLFARCLAEPLRSLTLLFRLARRRTSASGSTRKMPLTRPRRCARYGLCVPGAARARSRRTESSGRRERRYLAMTDDTLDWLLVYEDIISPHRESPAGCTAGCTWPGGRGRVARAGDADSRRRTRTLRRRPSPRLSRLPVSDQSSHLLALSCAH
jgi:hypothetical protein